MGKKDKKGETSDGSTEEEYVVEKVLDKRTVKGKVRYKIILTSFFNLSRRFLFIGDCIVCLPIIIIGVIATTQNIYLSFACMVILIIVYVILSAHIAVTYSTYHFSH